MPSVTLSYFDDQRRLQVFRTDEPRFTIGSTAVCDLVVEGLDPVACSVYLAEDGYFALETSGGVEVNGREGSAYIRDGGTLTLGGWLSFRIAIEDSVPAGSSTPAAVARPTRAPGTSAHRPGLAVFFSLLAGAGQAYNGRPIKGALFFLSSVLLVPWIWAFVDAYREATMIADAGGRMGRGGILWVLFHGWFAANVALTTAVVLTITGVLS